MNDLEHISVYITTDEVEPANAIEGFLKIVKAVNEELTLHFKNGITIKGRPTSNALDLCIIYELRLEKKNNSN